MSKQFKLTRDQQGEISFGLQLEGARKYNNDFIVAGSEAFIPLQAGDRYAIFLPSLGANYRISSDPNPTIPTAIAGVIQEAETTQNVAHISFENWAQSATAGGGSKRLYILSEQIQTMTILIYTGSTA